MAKEKLPRRTLVDIRKAAKAPIVKPLVYGFVDVTPEEWLAARARVEAEEEGNIRAVRLRAASAFKAAT